MRRNRRGSIRSPERGVRLTGVGVVIDMMPICLSACLERLMETRLCDDSAPLLLCRQCMRLGELIPIFSRIYVPIGGDIR